jgi:integrase
MTVPRRPAIAPVEPLAAPIAALDPSVLTPLAAAAVDALLAEGESAHTVRTYQAALRYWAAWFWLRYRAPIALPVPVAAVLQFVVDHAERSTDAGLQTALPAVIDQALVQGRFKAKLGPLALATVLHRLSVLSKAHQLQRVSNPVQDPKVRELVGKTRRAYAKRGVRPAKKAAVTLEPLQAMLATCDESLRGVRDRALLLFAWASGGRRRSEVTDATLENTSRVGPRAYTYTLLHSKTNQAGAHRPDSDKPIVDEAADALAAWIRRSGVRSGPLFRRIRRGDIVGEPLAPAAVRDIVRARAALAGLDEDFAAHSLRSGFVTEAARQGVSLGETMALTGHTSAASLVGYFRAADALHSRASRLFVNASPSPAQELPDSDSAARPAANEECDSSVKSGRNRSSHFPGD